MNHPNYGLVGRLIHDSNFRKVQTQFDPRQVQLGIKLLFTLRRRKPDTVKQSDKVFDALGGSFEAWTRGKLRRRLVQLPVWG